MTSFMHAVRTGALNHYWIPMVYWKHGTPLKMNAPEKRFVNGANGIIFKSRNRNKNTVHFSFVGILSIH